MTSNLFEQIAYLTELVNSLNAKVGSAIDITNEEATIVDVADPLKMGRVKVRPSSGGDSSTAVIPDWIPVLGAGRGQLSAQYIGASCILLKTDGASENMIVVGVFSRDSTSSVISDPVQVPVIGSQPTAFNRSNVEVPGDEGLKCNEANAGRVYVFSDEMSMSPAMCLRTNNNQEGDAKRGVWNWVHLTPRRAVEKGYTPHEDPRFVDLAKPGIPECNKAMHGQTVNFSEDRKFRTYPLVCGRDEDEKYTWKPQGSPPIVFRTNLPDCTEKLHGVQFVVDDGNNSQLATCARYQGTMKWVKPTRSPIQFHPFNAPLSSIEFLSSFTPIGGLLAATPLNTNIIGGAATLALSALGGGIPAFGAQSLLSGALGLAGGGGFNPVALATSIGQSLLSGNSGIPFSSLISQLTPVIGSALPMPSELQGALNSLGGAAPVLIEGIKRGNVAGALEQIGRVGLTQAFGAFTPELRSVATGWMAGGALGALDSAVLVGAQSLPPEISRYITPAVLSATNLLSGQSPALGNVLNAGLGLNNSGLQGATQGIFNTALRSGGLTPEVFSGLANTLTSGGFGDIAKIAGTFSNLSSLPTFAAAGGSIPALASTALGLIGQGGALTSFLGPAGIGLSAFQALTGINPVGSLLGAIPGLGSIFGGLFGGSDCPCDPKCRKTEHGHDSDGNKLLDPCGSLISNSSNAYAPIGNPLENNIGPVAEALGVLPTLIGEPLEVPNPLDLTAMIRDVVRVGEMSEKFGDTKNADWNDLHNELTYTFNAIQNTFKQADNNITKIESMHRKALDALFRLLSDFWCTLDPEKPAVLNPAIFPALIGFLVTHGIAIGELQKQIRALNATKEGPRIPVGGAAIAKTLAELAALAELKEIACERAHEIFETIVDPMDDEWRLLDPVQDFSGIVLGGRNPDLPQNFSLVTYMDEDRVLADSIISKLNSPVPPSPLSLIEASAPKEDIKLALDNISYAPNC